MKGESSYKPESNIYSHNPEKGSSVLLEQLKSLAGVEVAEKNDALVITITDKKRWEVEIPKLETIFGMTIFREYENRLGEFNPNNQEHKERLRHQCEVSFSGIDQMYIIIDNKKPIGFATTEHYGGESCSVVRDIIIENQARGKNHSKKLYSSIFENPKLLTLLGYSKTPEAIQSRISTGNEHGFKSYYGSECGKLPEVKIFMERMLKYLGEHGLSTERSEMPTGYALLNGELEILPAELLNLSLVKDKKIFESLNNLNELQMKELKRNKEGNEDGPGGHKKLPDTVVGLMISIRTAENK